MSSSTEMDGFLAALNGRRERLLQLVDADGTTSPRLLDEMRELAEQLIVADEELRVQQEELDDARQQLERLADERRLLLGQSFEAQVITDDGGIVLEVNRLADQLVLRPGGRTTPRPIATWFDVSDRRSVRSLIGRMASGSVSQELGTVLVRRSDGTTRPVSVRVTRVVDPATERGRLRWELSEVPALGSIGGAAQLAGPAGLTHLTDRRLVADLAAAAMEFAAVDTLVDLLGAVVAAAARIVPGAEWATLALVAEPESDKALWSSGAAEVPELADLLPVEGPGVEVLRGAAKVLVADLSQEGARWPVLPSRARSAGVLSVLSVAVTPPPRGRRGALTVYAGPPAAFDDAAVLAAGALAVQAGVAVQRVLSESQLRTGMQRRQLIGQAVGVLVERHRITPDQAFDVLSAASSHNNVKVRDLARAVVETGQEPADVRPQ